MTGTELALILSPLCTVAVAFVGRQRLAAVESRVDGHLDSLNREIATLKQAVIEARLSPRELPPLDSTSTTV